MRFIHILLIALTSIHTAFAVPAYQQWIRMRCTDGTEVRVMMAGDEHGHWFVDEAGRMMTMIDDGMLRYMTAEEQKNRMERQKQRCRRSNIRRAQRLSNVRSMAKSSQARDVEPNNIYIGKKHGVVLLVNYADRKFSVADSDAGVRMIFDKRFNAVGPPQNGYVGSVHDYFYDQSYGQFDLTFDVIGPITLPQSAAYYGQNDSEGDDLHPCEMVTEAVHLAHQQGADFSQYDWDGDDIVDQVFVIYAGTGENRSGIDNDVWPHEWTLAEGLEYNDGNGPLAVDGVQVDTYAVSCELAYRNMIDGIGTACHEFSHCLGLPDFYDTEYSGGQGMLEWDLMAKGNYCGPNAIGEVPVAYTAYERWMAGWLTPHVLDRPCDVTGMAYLGDKPEAYVIYNDACPTEYYMLENRQMKGWDSYLSSNSDTHGMLILHVDYDETAWTDNLVNTDRQHQRLCFVPADNSYGTYYSYSKTWTQNGLQMSGDPFPGVTGATEFTDESTPSQTLFNANTDGSYLLHKPITGIKETDGLISFRFCSGSTGVEPQRTASSAHGVYSLQGIRFDGQVDCLPEGMYIIDGKKTIKHK